MAQPKSEFENRSQGITGVVTIDPDGKRSPIPVKPGERVWLSEEEQIATANAPQQDTDNPFINGTLVKVTDSADIKNRRPIGEDADSPEAAEQKRKAEEEAARIKAANEAQAAEEAARTKQAQQAGAVGGQGVPAQQRQAPEETAAPPQPQGTAAQGSRAAGEEVATPEAVKKA
jgi:hypothetical protein